MIKSRTNQTLHIRELLALAIPPFEVVSTYVSIHAPTPSITNQDEAGGPVRPAVRVPYSASHHFPRHCSLSPIGASSDKDSNERAWAAAG